MSDEDHSNYDYVIVGGGTAGCVLAQRLSEDGRHSVCMLEAGPKDSHPNLHVPGGFIKAVSDPRYTWPFKTLPSDGTAGRQISIPQGRTLGGSSSLNGLVYNRGNCADFDRWASLGNHGWSYAELLPYFKRSERRDGAHDVRYRGTDGPMHVGDCQWRHPLCDAFVEAAAELGIPPNADYNGEAQAGAGYFQRIIKGRWRVSASTAYLRPALRRRNLSVKTGAMVLAIETREGRACAVRYAQAPDREPRRVVARREVLLCAGAVNTPKLLQLSGIGAAGMLAGLGIDVVADLPGVGENLRDHYVVRSVARVKGATTINDRARGVRRSVEIVKWALGLPSILTLSPSVAFAYWSSREGLVDPDLMFVFTPGSYVASVSGLLDEFPGMTLGFGQMRPRSTGFVRVVSPDPYMAPSIQPNYLSAEEDRQVVVDALRLVRRLFAASALARFVERVVSPAPEACADDELLDYARGYGNTAYHLIGTCKMGPAGDVDAVVDDQLRVRGIAGLRVIDASVMPDIPSANTMASVIAIAEKAADMVLGKAPPEPEDWAITPSPQSGSQSTSRTSSRESVAPARSI